MATKKTVIEMDWNELEEIVNKTYGINNYNFVASMECGNDSAHQFDVSKIEKPDEWYMKQIADIKNNPNVSPYAIMQDLVNRGAIEPGDYLITVCW
jgi:hypothetical protein